MFEAQEIETLRPENENENELCVQWAVKMAGLLPDDPDEAGKIIGMVRTFYATLTDLRQRAGAS